MHIQQNMYFKKLVVNCHYKLPFAGDEPWVNIFRVSEDSNVIDLDEVTEDMYNEYCQRFVEILSKRYTNSPLETTNKVVVY